MISDTEHFSYICWPFVFSLGHTCNLTILLDYYLGKSMGLSGCFGLLLVMG